MTCPNCHGEGWEPTREHMLENLGGRETFRTVIIRRYLCHNCGHAFYSEEKAGGPINRRTHLKLVGSQQSLFDGHRS